MIINTLELTSEDEIGELSEAFNHMANALNQYDGNLKEANQKLEEYNRTLEEKVQERTEELNKNLKEVEAANTKIMDSIRYAKVIQSSLLPNPETMKTYLPDSFLIWMPRDIVSGDFIFTHSFEDGFIIAVNDCTGHGAPGAFITIIAAFVLRKIIKDEGGHDPAHILKRLNHIVKTILQQDTEHALSIDN